MKQKGTIQKSKYDKDRKMIKKLLSFGLPVRGIAKYLRYNNHVSLNTYIDKRLRKAP